MLLNLSCPGRSVVTLLSFPPKSTRETKQSNRTCHNMFEHIKQTAQIMTIKREREKEKWYSMELLGALSEEEFPINYYRQHEQGS